MIGLRAYHPNLFISKRTEGISLLRYTFHRLLQLIPVMIGVVVIVFTINYFSDVSPAMVICGDSASPEVIEAKEEELGLNDPYLEQIGRYFYNLVVHGDMGTSYTKFVPVSQLIADRIVTSAIIGLLGAVLAICIGIPLGLVGALKQNTLWDYTATAGSIFCSAIPGFWLALLLMLVFSVKLRLTPVVGVDTWKGYINPIIVSAFPGIALLARMTRSSVLENINADFVKTARAKGLPEHKVIIKHVIRNSLIPVVTIIGSMLGHCITNGVVSESIFNISGIGSLMNSSITGKDYVTTQSCVLICAFMIALGNMLTDLFYAVIDPRIKAQYTKGKIKKKKAAKAAVAEGGKAA